MDCAVLGNFSVRSFDHRGDYIPSCTGFRQQMMLLAVGDFILPGRHHLSMHVLNLERSVALSLVALISSVESASPPR